MGRRPNKWVKFKDIPMDFVCAHRTEIECACDKETFLWCYCGRLTTGLHTSTCRQYRKHYQTKMEELYNANSN
jgi:hypothetical protein